MPARQVLIQPRPLFIIVHLIDAFLVFVCLVIWYFACFCCFCKTLPFSLLITLGPKVWDDSDMTLGSLRDHSGITLGSLWDQRFSGHFGQCKWYWHQCQCFDPINSLQSFFVAMPCIYMFWLFVCVHVCLYSHYIKPSCQNNTPLYHQGLFYWWSLLPVFCQIHILPLKMIWQRVLQCRVAA